MQFPNMEDDEGDFGVNSTTRSRLSSLFQTEKSSGDVNQALTFTAPKQPKKNDNSQSNQGPGTLKLIHASAVNAYKLIDGNYTVQGKLGCAILGWHEASNYQILLYKGKQIKVATCNIHQFFKFQVQQNNYATFYDDRKENWSINFDSEAALIEFAKQIALAKANSLDKSQPSLIIQDLTLGDGPSLDTGDSAEVKYTGWLLTNFVFGQVFDTNMQSESAFRVRLGKKVIKGWSEGLIGAQKGTRRLLIVPPHLAYGAEGMGSTVPPNSTLIFEIIVTKVKVIRDSSHSPSPLKTENLQERKPEVLPRHPSVSSEDNIRQRGASISEQLTQSPKKDKAQLISRMAKMGTATLPFQGAVAAQAESDTDSEGDVQDAKVSPAVQLGGSRTSSPKPASRSSSRKNSDHFVSAQPAQHQSIQEANAFHVNQQPSAATPFYPPTVLTGHPSYNPPSGAFPAFQPQITSQYQLSQYSLQGIPSLVPQVATSFADTHLPMLITETRSQNTEVRLSLSKITEKIDTVIQKVDDVRYNQGRSGGLNHSSLMNSSMLLQSIEKIVQENSQLKEDVEIKNSKIQSLNEKIYDLLQRNQRFFEESNSMLEQKSDTLQAASAETLAKLIVLDKEKAKLSSDLSDALHKLGLVESELTNHQKHESELSHKLQEERNHVEELDAKLSALRKKLESENSSSSNILQMEIKALSEEKIVLNSQIKSWEEKYALLNKDLIEKNREWQILQEQIDKSNAASKVSSNDEEIATLKKTLQEALMEKDVMMSKCKNMTTELSATKKSESLLKEKVTTLEAELQNALPWKGKYEVFYRKTLQMKENYEGVLKKLETELQQAQSSVTSTESPDFSGEIKRMMNILYKLLQGKFEPSSSYDGAKVLETTLQAIRTITVQMLQRKDKRTDTVVKEAESTSINVSNMNADNNESSVVEHLVSKDDSHHEVVSAVQDMSAAGDNSLSSELPPENVTKVPARGDAEQKTFAKLENSASDSQLPDNKVEKSDPIISESSDQPLQNHTVDSQNGESEKPIASEESSKSKEEQTVENKTISQDRASPDLSQQLSAANNPDTSNSVNSKVLDGPPSDMHAY